MSVSTTSALPRIEFPFELDRFQLQAMAALDAGRNVVVCAPTGSGKTVVAEHAVNVALEYGQRVFYTTPLKALSNQKFRDLRQSLGEDHVGLLTGDVTINRDADVVVMTTEVFRNMLYGTSLGAVDENLRLVRSVILDECHYMNDFQRGTVWEESIIYCPPQIQLVALSATVANADQLVEWMGEVHGETELVFDDHRPVPLYRHYFQNGRLSDLRKKAGRSGQRSLIPWRRRRHPGARGAMPDPEEVVEVLREREMLPAIYFIFSRRGCDAAMERCAAMQLLTPEQVAVQEEVLERFFEARPALRAQPHLRYLSRGLASHHAGLLPGWKAIIEGLFQANLLKVIFATETLAAGINMPARTTVISSIRKRGDTGFRSLTASEFLQISGRAGRRGMDKEGHVVVVGDPFRPAAESARLAAAPPDPLFSQFTPTYGMVLNLLQRHTLEQAHFLLRNSFGQYLYDRGRLPVERRQDLELQPPKRKEKRRARRSRKRRHRKTETIGVYSERFDRLHSVLEEYGYVDGAKVLPPGELGSALHADNQLLVAEFLLSDLAATLRPASLAAALTALATDVSRPNTVVEARCSKGTTTALTWINQAAGRLRRVQKRYQVDQPAEPAFLYCPLTELWANGADWDQMLKRTSMDEGGLVGVLRRTMDLTRQIIHAPGLNPELVETAREAVDLLNRAPVQELV